MNVIFMGSPNYATKTLKALLNSDDINVLCVFTQPDKPVGRKQILSPCHTKKFCQDFYPSLKVFTPNKIQDLKDEILNFQVDFIVVSAYGKILPKEILQLAPCINLHASILPKYRGASPIQSAILAGEKEGGVTAMLMDEGLDTGDMLDFSYTSFENKTSLDLFDELGDMGAELIIKTLRNFKNLKPIKQDESRASLCKKIKKEMGLFSFGENATQIYNKFRAFYPWPGIFLSNGLKILELNLQEEKNHNFKFGEILDISLDGVLVACNNGILNIKELCDPGKKPMRSKDYLNGKRLKIGNIIS